MQQRPGLNFTLMLVIIMSLFGSFTTLLFAIQRPRNYEDFFWRKPLIGSLFTLICVSGIIAAFYPNKCSDVFYAKKIVNITHSPTQKADHNKEYPSFKGHHPGCGRFSAHTICVQEHVLCAACTGLLLGAFVAIAGTILYFFVGWSIGTPDFLFVFIGQIGIASGFIQFKLKSHVRLAMNAFFVFAVFLTLVGIDGFANSTLIDLYLLALTILWLGTRILISQWDHWRICNTCKSRCLPQ